MVKVGTPSQLFLGSPLIPTRTLSLDIPFCPTRSAPPRERNLQRMRSSKREKIQNLKRREVACTYTDLSLAAEMRFGKTWQSEKWHALFIPSLPYFRAAASFHVSKKDGEDREMRNPTRCTKLFFYEQVNDLNPRSRVLFGLCFEADDWL